MNHDAAPDAPTDENEQLMAADMALLARCVQEGNRVNAARYIPVVFRLSFAACPWLHDTMLLVLSRS